MDDLHRIENTVAAGAPIENAQAALILVHGRGATAESMLPLGEDLGSDVALIAPQATASTWYPYTFMAPLQANEPWLSSALDLIGRLFSALDERGIPPERVGLLGFSQGACLAAEFAARQARRYGLVIGLSGGLIGPPGTPRAYAGSLAGTPVFLGCSDSDPHIPLERVQETSAILGGLGAEVEERIYPGLPHTVNDDEMKVARALVERLRQPPPTPA